MLSQVCWPILNSLPHPTAALRSHSPATLLTQCDFAWARSHLVLKNKISSVKYTECDEFLYLHLATCTSLCWSSAHFCGYFWFCFGTFCTHSQVTRDILSPHWLFWQYRTMWLQWYMGQRSGFDDVSILGQRRCHVSCSIMTSWSNEEDSLSSCSVPLNGEACLCTAPVFLCYSYSQCGITVNQEV